VGSGCVWGAAFLGSLVAKRRKLMSDCKERSRVGGCVCGGVCGCGCGCVCVCVCVFNKRKDSSMKEDVRNTIRLTHLSPASRSSSTVRGCYASATNTQGTQKCLEMTTYLAEKELQNIQSDQCGWKKEHHVQV